eukprot:scaffold135691_cov18-Prasinocladus_malaysianus.AAC.2
MYPFSPIRALRTVKSPDSGQSTFVASQHCIQPRQFPSFSSFNDASCSQQSMQLADIGMRVSHIGKQSISKHFTLATPK